MEPSSGSEHAGASRDKTAQHGHAEQNMNVGFGIDIEQAKSRKGCLTY
jgi:hypothetical protein